MNRRYITTGIVFFLLSFHSPFLIAKTSEMASGKFFIFFEAKENQFTWVAKAFEQNVYRDLSGFGRVIPVTADEVGANKCLKKSISCFLKLAKKYDVDAFMYGVVGKQSISYEVYDMFRSSEIKSGSISIGNDSNLVKVRIETIGAFKPFLERGGLLDQKEFRSFSQIKRSDKERGFFGWLQEDKSKLIFYRIAFLIFLGLIMVVPNLISSQLKIDEETRYQGMVLKLKVPFLIFMLATIIFLLVFYVLGYDVISGKLVLSFVEKNTWLSALVGGIAWGYFILLHFRFVCPSLKGIERAKQKVFLRFFQSWFFVSTLRFLFLLVLYLPIFFIMWFAASLFGASDKFALTVVVPLSGIIFYVWFGIIMECLSLYLDKHFIYGEFGQRNMWEPSLKKYFLGYLKRLGLSLDRETIDRVHFLPGKRKGSFTYGGFFSRPRVVIDKEIIYIAMGVNPHSRLGSLDPMTKDFSVGGLRANWALEETRKINWLKKKIYRDTPENKAKILTHAEKLIFKDLKKSTPLDIGEKEKLLHGIVFPNISSLSEQDSVGLISDDKEDLSIVDELIREGRKEFEQKPKDGEMDDNSTKDRDFLFGLQLRQFGTLLRLDNVLSTITLVIKSKLNKENIQPHQSLLFKSVDKHFLRITDSFVAFNFGLDHLLQYYYVVGFDRRRLLTRRGRTQDLRSASVDIIKMTKNFKEIKNKTRFFEMLIPRINWLSQFTYESMPIVHDLELRKWLKIGGGFIGTLIIVLLSLNSYNYSKEYLQIIENEKKEILEIKKKAKEKQELKNEQ